MIVGAYVRHAAPEHAAGAEWSIQDAFAWLARRGHDCRVMAERGATRERIDGVLVYSQPTDEEAQQHFAECDVMLTQLDATMSAQLLSSDAGTPLVQLVHSPRQLASLGVLPGCSALVVFNAEWVADACSWWPGASMTLRPPIDETRVLAGSAGPGMCVTLINMSHEKGAMQLWELAHRLPGKPFLGVMGAYGEQAILPDGMPSDGQNATPTGLPANMRVSSPVRSINTMLAYTRVLLSLSRTETYGRCAGEAMLNGIPVIAQRGPGLVECCGDAALYVNNRDDLHTLSRLVERAYDPTEWQRLSDAARDRARYNHDRAELELVELEHRLEGVCKARPLMRLTMEPHA